MKMNWAERLFDKMEELLAGGGEESSPLASRCAFVADDAVVCLPRGDGDARHPYSADGLTLWAHSSGYMSVNESAFYAVLPADEGREPYLNFYAAERGGVPVTLTGAAPFAGDAARRCCLFTPEAVYYLTRTDGADYCVRAFVTENKEVCFTVLARAHKAGELYLAPYVNCLLMHSAGECCETKWFKSCKREEDGFLFHSVENVSPTVRLNNYGALALAAEGQVTGLSATTSRSDFAGGKNSPMNASSALLAGRFAAEKMATKFTDSACAAAIVHFAAKAGGCARLDLRLSIAAEEGDARKKLTAPFSASVCDGYAEALAAREAAKATSPHALKMRFSGSRVPGLDARTFTRFAAYVQREAEFGALSKNSGVSLLGVRDVFQQLEAALLWTPQACRAKILEAFGFLGEDGRFPRQYSMPAAGGEVPALDLREFVDQALWAVDTLYRYVAYTGDVSILREECGFYRYEGRRAFLSAQRSDVLDHLSRIVRFFRDNTDADTGCLRALYGDWNDALDGLGVNRFGGEGFGSGVSVMASEQLVLAWRELGALYHAADADPPCDFSSLACELEQALRRHALQADGDGVRILHGWGDRCSYLVGSRCDGDGEDRVGLTANAFWVIAGLYAGDTGIKKDILRAYDRLDSKYGLRTFDKPFAPGAYGMGRIGDLPPGTAENCATYVHATLFGVWSLFLMGEGKRAWEQLAKVLPPTHAFISTTPFVMSNSYSHNAEYGMDGESMSDWYTGSANVLIKVLVRQVFGLDMAPGRLCVRPAFLPFDEAEIVMNICGSRVCLRYKNEGRGVRTFTLNGEPKKADTDGTSGYPFLSLCAEEIAGGAEICVTD